LTKICQTALKIRFERQDMANSKTAKSRIDQHEEICALRYKQIEARLDSGAARFVRLEQMIWGIYILIIGSQIIGAFI
tara:strand:- start:542 stop:775 length:234 start_codon:yes stop_codon:yes gene_type:complete